ncbi:hypothetical protein Pmani_006021 [Petrolisthes manimaculis]|uniref:Ionotropic glutamate receptor L-glutamate and glycine-binding domain-containing protein n=1 Tax=Petrolisthes manimaculis TaxID=1843537 RepID=A0AAE1UGW1_9EUCA|nr:hypothetical protein Pmani_006021 [Petrolisthes manimaculis]
MNLNKVQKKSTITESESQIFIQLDWTNNDTRNTLQYMNANPERVTQYSCVTFVLTQPPDPRFLPLLTDSSSYKRLTRYFLVICESWVEAERFLLDQRLREQVNVVALTRRRRRRRERRGSDHQTLWDVLIRKLIHPSGSPRVYKINQWSTVDGFRNTHTLFPEQMENFYGMKFTGATLNFKPLVDFDKIEGSRVVRAKPSLDAFMLEVIAKKLNFTYDLVMPEDGQWGNLKEKGVWGGVLGDVQFRRVNFSLCLIMLVERVRAADFTRMYFPDPMSFVTLKSRPKPPWQKIITPFQSEVWVMTVCSVVGGMLLYYVISVTQADLDNSKLGSSHVFIYMFGSFVSQTVLDIPWLSSGRVFLGFWLLHGLLVTTYYKTSLTGTLAVPFASPTLDTLQQLLSSDLKYGMKNSKGAQYHMFSTSKVPLYQQLFNDMHLYTPSKSMELVYEGQYAYFSYKSNLEFSVATMYTNTYGETDLHIAKEEFFPGGFGWAFPKAGLIRKWLQDLYILHKRENLARASSENRNGISDTNKNEKVGPFFALVLGFGGGVLMLLLEMVTTCLHLGKE